MLAFIRKKVSHESLAQDIFQATFLKFHRSRAQYSSRYLLSQWIFTICKSELIDAMRKVASSRLDFPEILPEPKIVEVQERSARELGGLDQLPIVQKQALELRYFEDKTFEEIAGKLDTTVVNARKLVSRAIKNLRSTSK